MCERAEGERVFVGHHEPEVREHVPHVDGGPLAGVQVVPEGELREREQLGGRLFHRESSEREQLGGQLFQRES